jgi:serine/threonine protein kinase
MHKKTTQYVLSGQCVNFPLLYHYRIIETKPKKIDFTLKKFKYWDSNKNIKEYMRCKSKTKYRILLLIEYFPKTIEDWIVEDLNNISSFYNQGFKIINFLNSKNIIHFDSHQGNFVVDINNNIYLTDYGLVLDKDFNLIWNDNKEIIGIINKGKYMFFCDIEKIINSIKNVESIS